MANEKKSKRYRKFGDKADAIVTAIQWTGDNIEEVKEAFYGGIGLLFEDEVLRFKTLSGRWAMVPQNFWITEGYAPGTYLARSDNVFHNNFAPVD